MIYLYAIATFMNPDCLRLFITTISLILSVIERHTELKFELRLQLVQVLGLDNTQTNFIKSSRLTLRFRNINMAHALASPAHVRASLSDGRLNEEKKRLNYGQKSPKASMSCVNIRDIINVDKTVPPIWRWCPESLRDARRRGWQIEKMFSSAKEKHLPQKFYKICKRKVDLGHISSINLFLESKLPKDIIEMLFDDMIAQGFISLVTKFGMFTHLHQATREEIRIAGEKGYEFLLGVMERRGSRNNFVKILNAFHQVLVEYFLNDRQKLLEDLLKQDENLPLLLNNKSCQAVDSSGHCSSGSNKVVHDIVEFNNGNNTENVVYQNAHFNQEIQHVPEQPNSLYPPIYYCNQQIQSFVNGTNNLDRVKNSGNDDFTMSDIQTNQQIHASLSRTKHVDQDTSSENVDFAMRDIGTNQQTHGSIAQAIDYTIKRMNSSANGTNNIDQATSSENDDVNMGDIETNQQIHASLSGTKHVDQVTCSENGDVNMGEIETNRQIHASLSGTKHVHQTTPSENVDFTMRDIGTNQQTHDSIAQAIDYTIKRINSSVNRTNNFDQARSCENDDVVMGDIRANQQIHASLSGTKHVDQVTCSENDDVHMGDIETNRQTQDSIAQAIDYTIKRMNSSVTGTDNIDQATSSENGDFTMSNIQINQQTCGSIDQSIVHQNMHDVLRSQGDDYFGNNGENCDSDRDPNNINWDVVYHNEHLYMHYEFPSHGDDHINENGENYYPDIDLEDMHAVHVIYHNNPHHVVHVLHSHRNDIVDDNGEYFVADGDNTNRNVNGFYRNDPQNAHRVSEGGDGHVVYNDEIFYNGDNAIIGANVIYQDEPQNMHQGFFVHGDGHVAENGEIQDADGAENEEEIVVVLVDEMGDAYSIPIGDHEEEMAEQLSEDDVDFQYAVHVQGNASRKRRRSSDDDDDRDEETRSPMCFKRRRLH